MIRFFSSSNFSALLNCAPGGKPSLTAEGGARPGVVLPLRRGCPDRVSEAICAPLEGPRKRGPALLAFMLEGPVGGRAHLNQLVECIFMERI